MDARALALAPSALFPTPVLSSACAARVSPANGARRSRTSAIPPNRASAQAENQPSAHPSTSATPPSAASAASAASPEALPRRSALAGGLLALASATLSPYLPLPALPPVAHAAADAAATVEAAGGSDLLKGLRSAFDSEEITASGRRLPKAYVRSVTALISSLRDALGAEEGDRGEFRRKADVAKGAIRAYLGEWRGKAPENTESVALASVASEPDAPVATSEPPSGSLLAAPCSSLATPCSLRVAPLQPARRPLRPARRPLQPARRPLAARLPPLCSPFAALWQPSRRPFAALAPPPCSCLRRPATARPAAARPAVRRPAGRPSRVPPCPALRASLVLALRPAYVLLYWYRATLLCPLWLLSEFSPSIMRAHSSHAPLAPSYASAAAVDILGAEDVGAASAISGKRCSSKGKGGRSGGGGSGGGGGGGKGGGGGSGGGGSARSGGGSGGFGGNSGGGGGDGGGGSSGSAGTRGGAVQRGGSGGGQRQKQQRRSETPSPQKLREWLFLRGASGGSVCCPYVIRTGDRAGQTCGKPHSQHCCFSCLDDASRTEFGDEAERPRWAELLRYGVDIFALDYDAILAAMYALSVSAKGVCYRCVPPDPGIEAAALGASEYALSGTAPGAALHTFTLDSGASRCFFRDSTTLTPFSAPVPVTLADHSGGPVLARSSTVLPCPAVPSGSLLGLHLPSFSTNLVSTAALQDAMVTTTTPGGQRVSICTCTRTGCHLAAFTRRPQSSLYTLATEPPQVAASAQVSASGPVAAPCSCRLLSHQTLLWHHRLDHPSLPRLRGMHSRLLVSGLPRSLPLLPPSPALPCLPCVEGRQRAAPHSSFPPTTAPLQTLHMDSVSTSASGSARNFLSCVCTLTEVQNRITERRIGLVMEVARTSMIHAAAPHFLWLFAVRYAAHQLTLWPHVSLPKTSPTLRWTGKVGDASVFRGPAPSGVSQVDPLPETVPVEVSIDSGAARGAASGGVASGGVASGGAESASAEPGGAQPAGAEPGGAESEGAGSGGAEPGGVEHGGTEPEGAEPGGAESEGAESGCAEPKGTASAGGPAGASPRLSPRQEPLSALQLREWFAQRTRLRSGAVRARGSAVGGTGAGGSGATSLGDAGGTGGAGAAGRGGARTRGVGDEGTGAGGTGAGNGGARGAGAGDPGAGGAGAGGTGTGGAGAGGARA
ncbi:unnamed protein product [Closterium sp. NIES-54]